MSRPLLRGRLKTAAVDCLRLINSPSTRNDSSASLFHFNPATMKSLPVVLCLFLATLASARDFRPESHFENVALADSSVQQCYVLQTTAGVRYTVESSNDLSHWTEQEEIYGLGNEYVVTMREYAPAPPPPPGTPPTVRPAFPARNASLMLRRSAGPAGGTVISWRSLDHGGPGIRRVMLVRLLSRGPIIPNG